MAAAQASRRSRSSRANRLLGWAAFAILALLPLPLGGDRPILWTATTLIFGILACGYSAWFLLRDREFRVGLGDVWLETLFFGLVALYAVVQILPTGGLVGGWTAGDTLATHTNTISLAPGDTILFLTLWLGFGMAFFLLLQVGANAKRARRIIELLFWVFVAYAVIGLLSLTQWGDTLLGMQKTLYRGSATGTFAYRNAFATFLAFGLAIGVALTTVELQPDDRHRHWVRISWHGLGIAVLAATLLATQSRMGVLSGAAGAVATVAFTVRKSRAGVAVAVALILGGFAVALLLLPLFGQDLLMRVLDVERSSAQRGDLYAQVWGMIAIRPLIGFGAHAFPVAFTMFHQLPVTADYTWNQSHSTYLALWSELGLIFGTLPMLLLLLAGGRIVRASMRSIQTPRAVTAAAIGCLVVTAIHSTVDFTLEIEANAYMLVTVVALALGACITSRSTA